MEKSYKTKLQEVIAGNNKVRNNLAKHLGCDISYIYMLEKGPENGGRRASVRKAVEIEEFFHGMISFEEILRPELYNAG